MKQSNQLFVNDLKGSVDLVSQNTGDSNVNSDSTSSSTHAERENNYQLDVMGVTKTIKKLTSTKKRYDKISDDMRLKLIDAVENKNEKIKHAAKRLGINYSSAKSICQVFKSEGRTNRKTFKTRGAKNENQQEIPNMSQVGCSVPEKLRESPLETSESSDDEIKSEADSLEILKTRLLKSRTSKPETDLFVQKLDLAQNDFIKQTSALNLFSKQLIPQNTQLFASHAFKGQEGSLLSHTIPSIQNIQNSCLSVNCNPQYTQNSLLSKLQAQMGNSIFGAPNMNIYQSQANVKAEMTLQGLPNANNVFLIPVNNAQNILPNSYLQKTFQINSGYNTIPQPGYQMLRPEAYNLPGGFSIPNNLVPFSINGSLLPH